MIDTIFSPVFDEASALVTLCVWGRSLFSNCKIIGVNNSTG